MFVRAASIERGPTSRVEADLPERDPGGSMRVYRPLFLVARLEGGLRPAGAVWQPKGAVVEQESLLIFLPVIGWAFLSSDFLAGFSPFKHREKAGLAFWKTEPSSALVRFGPA